MSKSFPVVVAIICFLCGAAYGEISKDGSGRMKFSFDSLPFMDESKAEPKDSDEYGEEDVPVKKRYTYDATGRRVPLNTERSGSTSPAKERKPEIECPEE